VAHFVKALEWIVSEVKGGPDEKPKVQLGLSWERDLTGDTTNPNL